MTYYTTYKNRKIMYCEKDNKFHAWAGKDLSAETAAELMKLIDEEMKK